jgi:hypothetical protein
MNVINRASLAVCLMALFLANPGLAADGRTLKTQLLSTHETVATFAGIEYRVCRGLTGACPERCGNSGEYALFNVVKYLKYAKPGKYGDGKQTSRVIQVSDFHKKPAGDPKLNKIIKTLKEGDQVLLSWNHNYVTRVFKGGGKSSSPQRPITKLEKKKAGAVDAGKKPDKAKKATVEEAKKKASDWLAALGNRGLVIRTTDKKNGFKGRKFIGRDTIMYVYQKDGWYINLMFKGEIKPNENVKNVRKRFLRVALDRLPTPGLDVSGWDIRPRTPVSSFSKGVEFIGLKDGVIQLRIRTNFFALYGRDPSVLVPADAPSPKTAYFQIRKNFPLDLNLEAPLAMSK